MFLMGHLKKYPFTLTVNEEKQQGVTLTQPDPQFDCDITFHQMQSHNGYCNVGHTINKFSGRMGMPNSITTANFRPIKPGRAIRR